MLYFRLKRSLIDAVLTLKGTAAPSGKAAPAGRASQAQAHIAHGGNPSISSRQDRAASLLNNFITLILGFLLALC